MVIGAYNGLAAELRAAGPSALAARASAHLVIPLLQTA